MQTQVSGDPRCGIGARLRSARERSGLTPLQAAERLHLDPNVIAALETETFESLGAPVYVRGHLKRYAELVGERAGELQQYYASSAQATALPDLTRIPKRAPPGYRRTLLPTGAAIVIGVAVVGIFWWVLREIQRTPMAMLDTVTASQPTPGSSADGDAAPPATPSSAPAPAPAPPATEPRVAPRMSVLTLRFSEDCWVEVYDANGQRLFFDIGSANTAHTLTGAAPLRVVLGNAPGVEVEFNGRPAVIPESALRDGQARFVVNRSGRIVRSRIATGGTAP